MPIETHPSQLMVCHERIDEKAASSAQPETYAFCQLQAAAWCRPCGYYICEIHAVSRHERHERQSVDEERAEKVELEDASRERRSGHERRRMRDEA